MRSTKAFIFVLRGSTDIDQMTPVIWQCLNHGEHVHAVIASDFDATSDFRLKFLQSYPNFTMRVLPGARFGTSFMQKLRRVLWNQTRVRRLLKKSDAQICIFEWGDGIWEDKPQQNLLKRIKRWAFTDFVLQAQYACAGLAIPTVSLPHGHSTKTMLIKSDRVAEAFAANNGKLPFANRNSFAKYVFCSGYHRDVIVGNSTMSGNNVEVWGTARFSPEWIEQLYKIAPLVNLPSLRSNQKHRVLMFLPKWHNLVNKAATLSLLTALGKLENIQLVIAGHVRGADTQLTASETAELAALPSVVFAPQGSASVSLIKTSDALIDVDASIALDAIQIGKLYVRPKYLQDASVQTIYDTLGGAVQASSEQEIVALLTTAVLPTNVVSPTFTEVVIGDVASNISKQYYLNLKALTQQ
jgi:hypothetical protein